MSHFGLKILIVFNVVLSSFQENVPVPDGADDYERKDSSCTLNVHSKSDVTTVLLKGIPAILSTFHARTIFKHGRGIWRPRKIVLKTAGNQT